MKKKKQTSSPSILVLGATGMLGRTVYAFLLAKWPETTWGTSQKKDGFLFFDAYSPEKSLKNIEKRLGKIDYIINCIGLLRTVHKEASEPTRIDFIEINSLFPLKLASYCVKKNIRFLHMSTDAVFGGKAGLVNEKTQISPSGDYAISKALGEPQAPNCLSIRASIVGCDPREKKGLIEPVRTGDKLKGFSNQLFSGCTVLQLARFYADLIEEKRFDRLRSRTKVLHFTPLLLSKDKLLKDIALVFEVKSRILSIKAAETITRKLTSLYVSPRKLARYGTTATTVLSELKMFEENLKYLQEKRKKV